MYYFPDQQNQLESKEYMRVYNDLSPAKKEIQITNKTKPIVVCVCDMRKKH